MTEEEAEKKSEAAVKAMKVRIAAARFALIETIAHGDSGSVEYATAVETLEKLEGIEVDDLI
jgi:hypothetical protein